MTPSRSTSSEGSMLDSAATNEEIQAWLDSSVAKSLQNPEIRELLSRVEPNPNPRDADIAALAEWICDDSQDD